MHEVDGEDMVEGIKGNAGDWCSLDLDSILQFCCFCYCCAIINVLG